MFTKPLTLTLATLATTTTTVAAALPDKDAPIITDLTWTKDVSTGSVFKASLTATDPLGVTSITFRSHPSQGWWYPCPDSTQYSLVNGTVFQGTWEAECPIPIGTPSQTYSFNYNCVDTEGHSSSKTFNNGYTVYGGPPAEYDAPLIEKVTSTETVTAGTAVDFHLTIVDESGVETDMSYVNIHQTDGNVVPCAATNFALYSGTATDGVYKTSCVIPADTPNGEYWLEVHVYDTQRNPADLNVDNAFEVVGGATPDHTPPSVQDIVFTNGTVELGETMSVTVTLSDQESGMDYANFEAREGYSQELLCRGPMTLQSGDMTSGVWAFSCEVPVDAMIASYSGAIYAFDNQNNQAMSSKSFKVVFPTNAQGPKSNCC